MGSAVELTKKSAKVIGEIVARGSAIGVGTGCLALTFKVASNMILDPNIPVMAKVAVPMVGAVFGAFYVAAGCWKLPDRVRSVSNAVKEMFSLPVTVFPK
jgi:hypothetical protein